MSKQNGPVQVDVTPEMAERWLQKNERNRLVRQRVVDRITSDIKRQAFDSRICNPIRFDSNNNLIDGQHRLLAVVASGCTVTLWVEHNVDSIHIDGARARTVGDIFAMSGLVEQGASRNAQAIIFAIMTLSDIRSNNRHWLITTGRGVGFSREEAIEALLKIEDFDDLVRRSCNAYKLQPKMAKMFTQSAAAVLMHFAEIDAGAGRKAEEFLRCIAVGEGLTKGDPELAYRKWALSQITQIRYRIDIPALFYAFRRRLVGEPLFAIRQIGDVSAFKA